MVEETTALQEWIFMLIRIAVACGLAYRLGHVFFKESPPLPIPTAGKKFKDSHPDFPKRSQYLG